MNYFGQCAWRRRSLTTLACICCACALTSCGLAGCDGSPIEGPPQLRLGRDICAECGMSVLEDRCSAAMLVERPDGRTHLLFDDIGCLLDYERQHREERIVGRFVHDHGDGTWISAPAASYLMAESIRTPMDSWLIAFTTAELARSKQEREGGSLLTWRELDTVRRQWLRDRRLPSNE